MRFFDIKGIDADQDKIQDEINNCISQKEKSGAYVNLNLSSDNKLDFTDITNEDKFTEYYLKVIKRTWAIDINDFEITRKNGLKGFLEFNLKKIIWKLLKFYTYRLWSQQIEFNSQIKNSLIAIHNDFNAKISRIKKEIDQLNDINSEKH